MVKIEVKGIANRGGLKESICDSTDYQLLSHQMQLALKGKYKIAFNKFPLLSADQIAATTWSDLLKNSSQTSAEMHAFIFF